MIEKRDGFEGETVCVLPEELKSRLKRNPLTKDLYFTDVGFYPNAKFHKRERQLGSKEYILIYCITGCGWYCINGTNHSVKSSQFFILPKDSSHSYGADNKDPWSIFWVHFNGAAAKALFNYLSETTSLNPKIVIPSGVRNRLFYEIIKFGSMISNKDALIYACSCLISYLTSFKSTIFSKTGQPNLSNKLVDECIALMRENLEADYNLFELAEKMHISVSHLSKIFKETIHDTPYKYYIFLKMQRACYLLWNTEDRIKTIALKIGYEDPYHFSRVFKRVMGLSPRNFKNRSK